MSMSTPIHQLPPSTAVAPPTDDPEVLSMLNDLDREVQDATRVQNTALPPPPRPISQPLYHPPPMVKRATPKGLWDASLAQKAAVYAVLGMIVFYPATLQFLYSKIPKFEGLFTSYDFVIRTAVLAVVLYFALMYLPM